MKKLFNKLKAFIDVWKIWLFLAAIIGSNGLQAGFHMNNDDETHVKKSAIITPSKPTIIYKPDNAYCDKKLNDHEKGELH